MTSLEEHVSPDRLLRLLVIREDGDVTIGFDGYPWHTHGDVVAGELELLGERQCASEDAAKRFVSDILSGRVPIGVRRGGRIQDVWATYLLDPDPYQPEGEELEIRRWDGTPWSAS
jgi:hypothetical protein